MHWEPRYLAAENLGQACDFAIPGPLISPPDASKGRDGAAYRRAESLKAGVVLLKEKLKALKKADGAADAIEKLETRTKEQEKAACDSQSKADAIGATVFDLKAVNPNVVVKVDTRTPAQVIQSIEEQSRIVSKALETLRALLPE